MIFAEITPMTWPGAIGGLGLFALIGFTIWCLCKYGLSRED